MLAHIVDTERDFLVRHALADGLEAGDGDPVPADLLGRWAATRDRVQAALDDPATAERGFDGYFGPTTIGAALDTFYSGDLVVHGWDVARAAGLAELEAIDPLELDLLTAEMETLGDAVRMEGIYGPPVEVADDASAQDRFLAWTGRRP